MLLTKSSNVLLTKPSKDSQLVNKSENKITDDPDIEAKLNDVINQIMFELARMKKIPAYVEVEVNKNDLISFSDIAEATDNEVYQLDIIKGLKHELKANGTIIKAFCLKSKW